MAESSAQLAEIRAAILAAYGSLDEPTFRGVRPSLDAPPFPEVAAALGRGFAVEDDTDPNTDVARVLVLRRGAGHWAVSLSLVGPYACVLRVETAGGGMRTTLLEEPGPHVGEGAIFDALAAHGFRVLPQAVLEEPVPLRLWAADPENVRVYQALFTDTDVLPWRAAEPPPA